MKVRYPFIYFLIKIDIAIVYRIETEKYLTISDVFDSVSWETFKINSRDDFEMFNHQERQPIEGRGFCVNQDDMNKIVEVINEQIQKNRHLMEWEDPFCPIHIVTSESAAGSLRVGLEKPTTIIGFPDSFSIGSLWKLDEKIGRNFRNDWIFEQINFELDDYEYENTITNTLREIEDITNHTPIYIWYGNNADEQIGLRFFLYLLREKTNEIFLINSTELYRKYATEEEHSIVHTSQMNSKSLRLLFENNNHQSISNNKRIQFQKDWEMLSKTKKVLRLWLNDGITHVPEHYYDPLIIETIKKLHHKQGMKDFIKAGVVIGEIVTQMDMYIDCFFLEYRKTFNLQWSTRVKGNT